jgi:hypothetical protein
LIIAKLINKEPDFRTMVRVQNNIEKSIGQGVQEATEALQKYIKEHWSPAPSAAGEPPAVQTGNLDSSILVDDQKRDTSGRFSTDAIVMFLRADTTEGTNPMGRGNYTQAVQEQFDRPFIDPAIEAVQPLFAQILKRSIKTS